VERVFLGRDDQHATHLMIKQGLLFKTRKPIPVSWIRTVEENKVTLAVSADLLKRLPDRDE
jgi:hypothetical protein